MACDPIIRLLRPDGTPDSRFVYEGLTGYSVSWAAGTGCTLMARGGCRGGRLVLPGTGIDWPAIDARQIVEFYWDRNNLAAEPFWRGRVKRGVTRQIEGDSHRYELAGGWDGVDDIELTQNWLFGYDEGQAGTNSIHGLLTFLFETVLGISGVDYGRDIVAIESAALTANTTGVRALTLLKDGSVSKLAESLEFMAQGNDEDSETPAPWVIGMDGRGIPYFKRLPSSLVQLTVQTGIDEEDNASGGEELVINDQRPARIALIGGIIPSGPSAGRIAKIIYSNPHVTVSQGGRGTPHKVYAPGLDAPEDMQKWTDGWFAKFGKTGVQVRSLSVIADEMILPWMGLARYRRPDQFGAAQEDLLLIDSVDFAWEDGALLRMAIGDEQEPRSSGNQGLSIVRKVWGELAGVAGLADLMGEADRDSNDGSASGGGGMQVVPGRIVSAGGGIYGVNLLSLPNWTATATTLTGAVSYDPAVTLSVGTICVVAYQGSSTPMLYGGRGMLGGGDYFIVQAGWTEMLT